METGCNTQLKMILRKYEDGFTSGLHRVDKPYISVRIMADGTGKERRQTSNAHLCWGPGSWETMKAPTTGL